ncbi:MAG: ROK family protein [Lactobacillales bacterium]|nr:ROK family protein [Lactobacillales bacterium]
MVEKLLGSIEAGGTKFVCAVADFEFNEIDSAQFPTETPEVTMANVFEFFKKHEVVAIGIGSFGPIDINLESETYGFILSTPKLAWTDFDFLGAMKEKFDIPMYWTTDVNASAYGEYVFGNAKGTNSCVYFTVGTGIGGGAIQKGEFIGGISHAEMGHAFISQHPADKEFEGVCPYHKNKCLEGLAAGPSLEARTGIKGELIPQNHEVWDILAYYIAQAAYNAVLTLAPEKIIFGGGVMGQTHLMKKVRTQFAQINNGYIATPELETYIVNPAIKNNGSATIGNFALAKRLLEK